MGKVDKPQIQTMLQGIVDGKRTFDDYVNTLGYDPPNVQIQLRAALDQRREGKWSQEDFERIRNEIRSEYDLSFKGQSIAIAPPPKMFNPLASQGTTIIPQGLKVTVLPASMGKAEKRSGQETDLSNPTRTKSGTFRADVAEVWFLSPTTEKLKRRMFLNGETAIAEAFAFANKISAEAHMPSPLLKFRSGKLKGAKHVLFCTPDGMAVTVQTIVEWHAKTRGFVKAPVGEKVSKLSRKVILAMVEQNAYLRKVFGSHEVDGLTKLNGGLCLDIPTVEPPDSKELDFRVLFLSGNIRVIQARPRTDVKDCEGNVTLAGHKRQAYTLLLESVGEGADGPKSCKYTFEGKVYVVSRREAIEWTETKEQNDDDALEALRLAFEDGHMNAEEYFDRVATYTFDRDNPGRREAKDRYLQELSHAHGEGMISNDSFEYMQSWNHPAWRERRPGPTMWERSTRVEYGADGRMVWQRAKNDNTPGSRWVGGQSAHEAMLYNL
jgi:hypothetical protein